MGVECQLILVLSWGLSLHTLDRAASVVAVSGVCGSNHLQRLIESCQVRSSRCREYFRLLSAGNGIFVVDTNERHAVDAISIASGYRIDILSKSTTAQHIVDLGSIESNLNAKLEQAHLHRFTARLSVK